MTEGPLFWYLNRATGLVLLVLMTLSVVLGVLATSGRAGRGVPRFVSQSLHRNLSLLSVLALLAHVTTAVADEYVDIRWWQALVPVGATYRPLWLGLGTVSLDLLAVVVLTSVLRTRLSHRSWRLVHLSSWLAFAAAVAHSVGIGTDLSSPDALGVVPALVCVTAVLVALAARLGSVARDSSSPATGRSA